MLVVMTSQHLTFHIRFKGFFKKSKKTMFLGHLGKFPEGEESNVRFQSNISYLMNTICVRVHNID